jgi:ubiquitin-conjugating enzyme E2 G2
MKASNIEQRITLEEEFQDLIKPGNCPDSVYIEEQADSSAARKKWSLFILGRRQTSFDGGVFELQITFPKDFPASPPSLKFITEMVHPNISSASGKVMLSVLQPPHPLLKDETWNSSRSMKSVVEYLTRVLYEPHLELKHSNNTESKMLWQNLKHEYENKQLGSTAKSRIQPIKTYKIGEEVRALIGDSSDANYEKGILREILPRGYSVKLESGKIITTKQISKFKFKCGELIKARWKKKSMFYPGVIISMDKKNETYGIRYDDGDIAKDVPWTKIVSAPLFHIGDYITIDTNGKSQNGEICKTYPNLNLYDALISGKLVQGKFVLKSEVATHFTQIDFPYKLHQKIELLSSKNVPYDGNNLIFAPFTTLENGKITSIDTQARDVTIQMDDGGSFVEIDFDLARKCCQLESGSTYSDNMLSNKSKNERYAFQVGDIVDFRFMKTGTLRCKIISIESSRPVDLCTLEFKKEQSDDETKTEVSYLESNIGTLTLVCPFRDSTEEERARHINLKKYLICKKCTPKKTIRIYYANENCKGCSLKKNGTENGNEKLIENKKKVKEDSSSEKEKGNLKRPHDKLETQKNDVIIPAKKKFKSEKEKEEKEEAKKKIEEEKKKEDAKKKKEEEKKGKEEIKKGKSTKSMDMEVEEDEGWKGSQGKGKMLKLKSNQMDVENKIKPLDEKNTKENSNNNNNKSNNNNKTAKPPQSNPTPIKNNANNINNNINNNMSTSTTTTASTSSSTSKKPVPVTNVKKKTANPSSTSTNNGSKNKSDGGDYAEQEMIQLDPSVMGVEDLPEICSIINIQTVRLREVEANFENYKKIKHKEIEELTACLEDTKALLEVVKKDSGLKDEVIRTLSKVKDRFKDDDV